MNKLGLVFNILLSLLVLSLSCSKNKTLIYTGIYDAFVEMTYDLNDSVHADTSLKTIIVVNHSYTSRDSYQIQWYFDDFLVLRHKKIKAPNTVDVIFQQNLFDNPSNVKLRVVDTSVFRQFTGYFRQDTLFVSFFMPEYNLAVKLKAAHK